MSIVLESLHKRYGATVVVHDVSLEVAEGELFVLLGTSGSGKSTILRLIAGLQSPDSGRVLLRGRDVTDAPPQSRGTGFVFQNYSVFRHMSVAENIEFGMRIRKVPAAQRARRREELLELVGMGGLGSRFASELSGGQQQRVALARALAYEPTVLLLDEPFGALDVKIRQQLRRSLREVQKRLGVTAILVTHDQEEAFELADRVGVLDHGRLIEVGAAEELYARPRTQFAATFLGGGTVLVGRVQDGKAKFGRLLLPLPPESWAEDGAAVQVLIRPEHVMLSERPPADSTYVAGCGPVIESGFAGALERLRIRVPHLAGTRQVAPVVSFGEGGLVVDATVAAKSAPAADQVWVSLRAWHLLERPEPRVLALALGGEPHLLGLSRWFADRMDAGVTLLGVAESADQTAEVSSLLERFREESALGDVAVRLRAGDLIEQVEFEQNENLYDFIVVAAGRGVPAAARSGVERLPVRTQRRLQKLGSDVAAVIAAARAPVLVVRHPRREIRRMLICTAVGEPGKQDIRVGGRLARRMQASITVLHVTNDTENVPAHVRDHLIRGVMTIRALDVPVETRITSGRSPARAIVDEARAGDYDLIVLGRRIASPRHSTLQEDVVLQVLLGADRPVLVVPFDPD
jgi:sulfate transport system ATP-binding protein